MTSRNNGGEGCTQYYARYKGISKTSFLNVANWEAENSEICVTSFMNDPLILKRSNLNQVLRNVSKINFGAN